jgi:hypothetical protein
MINDLDKCLCGHYKVSHEPTDSPRNPPGDSFCNECLKEKNYWDDNKIWHDFKLDNLAYFENLYEQRTKTKA